MNFLIERLRDRVGVVEKNIRELSNAGDGHIKGTLVELDISNLIQEFIPENCGITSGWIFNSAGERSDERDLIIYDKRKAPQFLISPNTGLIPKICTRYDIQIKSSLTEKTLKHAATKFIDNCTAPSRALIAYKFASNKKILDILSDVDEYFFTGPKISIIAVGGAGYYFLDHKKLKIKDVISEEKMMKDFLGCNGEENVKIANNSSIKIKGVYLHDISERIVDFYAWESFPGINSFFDVLKAFMMGMVNTLYGGGVSSYFGEREILSKTFSKRVHFEGKEIYSRTALDEGFDNTKETLSFTVSLSDEGKVDVSCRPREN